MATLTLPSSFSTNNFKYNRNGGSWDDPYGSPNSIMVGRTGDGTIYRSYIYVPAKSDLNGAVINGVALKLTRQDSYSNTATIAVGIMNSLPGNNVSTSDFTTTVSSSFAIARNSTVTLNITADQWGDPTKDKYIVLLYVSNYCELLANTSTYPTVTIDFDLGVVYIGNGTTYDKYQVFIGNGTKWEQYIPYIGNGSSWDRCG